MCQRYLCAVGHLGEIKRDTRTINRKRAFPCEDKLRMAVDFLVGSGVRNFVVTGHHDDIEPAAFDGICLGLWDGHSRSGRHEPDQHFRVKPGIEYFSAGAAITRLVVIVRSVIVFLVLIQNRVQRLQPHVPDRA